MLPLKKLSPPKPRPESQAAGGTLGGAAERSDAAPPNGLAFRPGPKSRASGTAMPQKSPANGRLQKGPGEGTGSAILQKATLGLFLFFQKIKKKGGRAGFFKKKLRAGFAGPFMSFMSFPCTNLVQRIDIKRRRGKGQAGNATESCQFVFTRPRSTLGALLCRDEDTVML
jgi:hypothetical protein